MSKSFTVQYGSGKPETVNQEQLDQMKKAFGQSFSEFSVKEAKPEAKPADLVAVAPAAPVAAAEVVESSKEADKKKSK